jgi:nucleoside-diphosphate-sugar epimerase
MSVTHNEPVNLGNPYEFTMLELAEKVIALTKSKSKIIFLELPEDDPKRRKPDISKAQALLGWEPIVQLEEGLVRTIEFFSRETATPALKEVTP